MLDSLFRRQKVTAKTPAPSQFPLPPSTEKRQEKEKAWLASIQGKTTRKGSCNSNDDSAFNDKVRNPRVVEHVVDDQRLSAERTLDKSQSRHVKENTSASMSTRVSWYIDNNTSLSLGTGFSSFRLNRRPRGKDSGTSRVTIEPLSSTISSSSPVRTSLIGVSHSPPADSLFFSSISSLPPPNKLNIQEQGQASPSELNLSLPQRLQDLATANSQGLLDDDAYRLLRQDLFETMTNHHNNSKETDLPVDTAITRPGTSQVERTGTLLKLPRLQVGAGDSWCKILLYLLSIPLLIE